MTHKCKVVEVIPPTIRLLHENLILVCLAVEVVRLVLTLFLGGE